MSNREDQKQKPEPTPKRPPVIPELNLKLIGLVLLSLLIWQMLISNGSRTEQLSYSEFKRYAIEGQLESIEISDQYLTAKLRNSSASGASHVRTYTVDPALAEEFSELDLEVSGAQRGNLFVSIITSLAPLLLLFVFWSFILRRSGSPMGGMMSVGGSKARRYQKEQSDVTFKDVAGVDEAIEELQEIVNFLQSPESYGRLGGHIPHGILLVGPPGTGKTLLARAIAGEAGVPFFSINGSEFVEMFVGVGAARVRDLFRQARENVPCIIFIDELDALGRARGVFPGVGGHDEKEQTLNQLLSELDGFDAMQGVVLLAATNRPEILDPALLRAGRFDRQVLVDRPDRKGRIDILKVHLKKIKIDDDIKTEELAALTPGFTGADLANLVNEAALLATRRNADTVAMQDVNNAIERIVAGLEKRNRLLNENERRFVAFHEMGHAITAMSIPGSDPIQKVSIIPRGIGALGYTLQRPLEDRYLMTQQELEDKMAVLLGGRAAEYLCFKHFSTGAADDIDKATDIARSMITRYGMNGNLGHVTYDRQRNQFLDSVGVAPSSHDYSDETSREIDCAVREATHKAFERAVDILSGELDLLEQCANELLAKETLSSDELAKIQQKVNRKQSPKIVPLHENHEP